MRETILIKAVFLRCVLRLALLWCRWCRWWHVMADNLCGWLASKAVGDLPIKKETLCSESGSVSK
jgi:hypothetical protein